MSNERTALMTEPQRGIVAAHQPGQDVFKSVLSENIDWKPFAAFPLSVRLAVIVGQPSEAGPYTIRVRVPHDVKADATPTPGGSCLHSDFRRFLHRSGRSV